MRFIITLSILLCTLAAAGQTSLYIVGTVHDRTRNYNSDSILNILERLKPDLILLELDSSLFDRDFQLNGKLRTNETAAVKKYNSKHPTPVRPFDINSRLITMNAANLEAEVLDRLSRIEWKLTPDQRQAYHDSKKSNDEVVSYISKKPFEINQQPTYLLVEKNQILLHKGLSEVVESRRELEDLRIGFRQSSVFWDARNRRMAGNILTFLKMETFKNKTIVLLAGYFHKCYLLNELLPKQDQYQFVIKEYYNRNSSNTK